MAKSALDGKRMNMFGYPPEELIIVGIDTDDGEEHPLYDNTFRHEVSEPMMLNIMELGVLENVLVTKEQDDSERGYRVLVVDGRRRVLHARAAKAKLKALGENDGLVVPVTLQKGDEDLMERISMSANFLRMDDTVLTKAERIGKLLRRNGHDYAAVAIATGMTVKTVKTYEGLLGLGAVVKKAIDAGSISATAAANLVDLSKADQEAELKRLLAASDGKKVTTRQTRAATGNGKPSAPKKRILKKLVSAHPCGAGHQLSEQFLLGVQFAIGITEPGDVPGLQDALDSLK